MQSGACQAGAKQACLTIGRHPNEKYAKTAPAQERKTSVKIRLIYPKK